MKKIYKKLGVLLFLLVTACNLDGDLTNPNEVSVAGADPNLLMNAVQLDFADLFYSAAQQVNPLVRHEAMTGGFRYQTAYQPQNEDGVWTSAYRNVLINAETLIPLANKVKLTTHVAVAQILEAYTYLILADVFGDVPQAEALLGNTGNFNPKQDAGSSVYAHALVLLDSARLQLAKTGTAAGSALARDIYYGGSRTNWTALANTLELKAQLNLSTNPSTAAAANARIAVLLTSNIIDDPTGAENFTYKYGTATVPNSRHPLYNQYYGPAKGSAGGYINNGFLFEMYKGKPDPTSAATITAYPATFTQDPRWRYYFYRQAGSIAQIRANDAKAIGCTPAAPPNHYAAIGATGSSTTATAAFCIFDPGFYGRDHGDASGTPPDSPDIVCAGVYPAAGRIDDNLTSNSTYTVPTTRGDGGNGAGILPMMMSFYTDYWKAEITARSGNSAGALTQLHTAINNSITQVRAFATGLKQTFSVANGVTEPSTAKYLSAVDVLYGAQTKPLDVIGREFWIASWGNGIEAYNSYRRTSSPFIMQPTIQTGPGPWLRSMTYPAVYVNLNANAKQKDYSVTNKVFWDGNTDVLN